MKLLNHWKTKRLHDIDHLSTKIYIYSERCGDGNISGNISFIFNKSMESGVVPKNLKISRTVPFYKSGPPSDLTNSDL